MEAIKQLVHYVLHFDKDTLSALMVQFGAWTYLILFAVIFCETGLVVTPFLPGDSLLFAAGTFAGMPSTGGGSLDVTKLFFLLSGAAILGDNINYWFGAYVGPRAFSGKLRFLKKKHLDRTHEFYEKYGPKAVILARFVPIVRTFSPFVAGVGAMSYRKFLVYDVMGGVIWVGGFLYFGYFIGSRPLVQHNFKLVILAIVLVSVMPIVVEVLRARLQRPKT